MPEGPPVKDQTGASIGADRRARKGGEGTALDVPVVAVAARHQAVLLAGTAEQAVFQREAVSAGGLEAMLPAPQGDTFQGRIRCGGIEQEAGIPRGGARDLDPQVSERHPTGLYLHQSPRGTAEKGGSGSGAGDGHPPGENEALRVGAGPYLDGPAGGDHEQPLTDGLESTGRRGARVGVRASGPIDVDRGLTGQAGGKQQREQEQVQVQGPKHGSFLDHGFYRERSLVEVMPRDLNCCRDYTKEDEEPSLGRVFPSIR